MARVFLNIFSNGFYAAPRQARDGGDAGFMPTLNVSTRDFGDAVDIRVRDNGTGILADIRDKNCPSRSSPPSQPATAPALVCRSPTTSSAAA
jgi:hypothetical protein